MHARRRAPQVLLPAAAHKCGLPVRAHGIFYTLQVVSAKDTRRK